LAEAKHNRRNFIKLAGLSILAGTLVLWDRLVHKEKLLSKPQSITLPFNPNQEVSFQQDVIIINKNDGISVYSSRCSHLGCTINNLENNELVCPCHGSKYNLEGTPIKGPAIKPLEKLAFKVDEKTNQITIRL
jgi:cytochrome b6-f complex iron-sulfur subunit